MGQPGGFGYARQATRKSDERQVAVKVIEKKSLKDNEFFIHEQKILHELDHPGVVGILDCFEDAHHYYLVMELCLGKELFDRIIDNFEANDHKSAYNEQDAAIILRQIFETLTYIHSKGIAHCDLKPDNFMFLNPAPDETIKIIDFGLAKHSSGRSAEALSEAVGTSIFMAPEVYQENYTFHCDLWSMGVVMFTMLFGYYPFGHGLDSKNGLIPENTLIRRQV